MSTESPDSRHYLSVDEWYPVFTLVDHITDTNNPISLTAEEFADYQRVAAEFEAWQKRLRGHDEAFQRRLHRP